MWNVWILLPTYLPYANMLMSTQLSVHECVDGMYYYTQVEVALPRYRTVNLGALMIGQTVRRSIPIVNRSILPVNMSTSLSPKDPDCQDISVLRLLTTSLMTIQPPKQQGRRKVEQIAKITVAFSPKKRMKQFVEEVSQRSVLLNVVCYRSCKIPVYKYWLVPRSTLKNFAPKLCNVARGPKARG